MGPKRRRAEASDGQLNAGLSAAEAFSSTAEQSESSTHQDPVSPDSEQNSSPRDGNDTNIASNRAGTSRKKSEPVKSACGQCQKRKTKCSGQRPVCGFCHERGLECSWEIGDGLTRNADLRQRLAEANEHAVDVDMLVHHMRTNTDAVATTLLAKLRLGDSIRDLATGIREGTSMEGNDRYDQARRPSQGAERCVQLRYCTAGLHHTDSSGRVISTNLLSTRHRLLPAARMCSTGLEIKEFNA